MDFKDNFYFLGWFEGFHTCIFFQNYGFEKKPKNPTIWIKFYKYKIDISKNRK